MIGDRPGSKTGLADVFPHVHTMVRQRRNHVRVRRRNSIFKRVDELQKRKFSWPGNYEINEAGFQTYLAMKRGEVTAPDHFQLRKLGLEMLRDCDRFDQLRSGHDRHAQISNALLPYCRSKLLPGTRLDIAVDDFVVVPVFEHGSKREQRQRHSMFPARTPRIEQQNHDCVTCVRTVWSPSAFFKRLIDFKAQSSTGQV